MSILNTPVSGGIQLPTLSNPAGAAQILSGYQAINANGEIITGTILSQGAQTITPGTSSKTIASGRYLSGTQTIQGDSDLRAANIKDGVNIFGITGSFSAPPLQAVSYGPYEYPGENEFEYSGGSYRLNVEYYKSGGINFRDINVFCANFLVGGYVPDCIVNLFAYRTDTSTGTWVAGWFSWNGELYEATDVRDSGSRFYAYLPTSLVNDVQRYYDFGTAPDVLMSCFIIGYEI